MDIITLLVIFHLTSAVCMFWPMAAPFMYEIERGQFWNVIGGLILVLFLCSIPVYNAYAYFTRPPFVAVYPPDEGDQSE